MTLSSREGSRIPDVQLYRIRDGAVQRVSAVELLGRGRVVVFALPGAFTPTCSTAHVPGYVARAKADGIGPQKVSQLERTALDSFSKKMDSLGSATPTAQL